MISYLYRSTKSVAYQQNYVSEILLAVVYIGAVGLLLDLLPIYKRYSHPVEENKLRQYSRSANHLYFLFLF